jgi:hypothetical protein
LVPLAAGIEAGQSGTTDPSKNALDLFIPAIYSAWQWKPSGTPAKPSGSCPPCDGKQGSFDCAYIFPCYSDEGDVSGWGHRDTSVGGVPRINFLVAGCNTHLPNGMLATTTQHKHFCVCSFSKVAYTLITSMTNSKGWQDARHNSNSNSVRATPDRSILADHLSSTSQGAHRWRTTRCGFLAKVHSGSTSAGS